MLWIFSFAFPTIVLINAGTDIHLNNATLQSKEKKEIVLIAAGIRSLLLRARASFSIQEKTHNIWHDEQEIHGFIKPNQFIEHD